jgi:hypothetical protein
VLAELTARSAADAVLQSNLDGEAVTREANDVALQSSINQEEADRVVAVNAEATLRGLADDVILSNLDAEAAARLSNDNTLQSNLDSEVGNRISAVDAEATARTDADNLLSASINTEKNRAIQDVLVQKNRIDAILSGSDLNLDQLTELVNAYTTSDSNILAQIGLINSTIVAIQTQLDGTDTALNTLLANIEIGPAPVLTPIFTVENGLSDNSLTYNSFVGATPKEAFKMFDGRYNKTPDNPVDSWTSQAKQNIIVDGVTVNAHYNMANLSNKSPVVIKAFQVWSSTYAPPTHFYIVGSNTQTEWTKLYEEADVSYTVTEHGRNHTGVVMIDNSNHYDYFGIVILSATNESNASVSELRLFESA